MGGGPAHSNRTSPGHNNHNGQSIGSPSTDSSPPPLQRLVQPNAPAAAQNAMSVDVFNPVSSTAVPTGTNGFSYALPPIGHAPTFENQIPASVRLGESERANRGMNGTNNGMGGGAAILIRGLPLNTSLESLRTMLLFAKDLVDADFLRSEYSEDNNFLTAVARFQTLDAAEQARTMLDGKPNSTNDANMIVDVVPGNNGPPAAARRYTIDNTTRGPINPPATSAAPPVPRQQTSRYAFENFANSVNTPTNDLNTMEGNSRLHSIFSAQSSIGNTLSGNQRVTGKSVIDQDVDEDTGELLKDPVAYAQNGHAGSAMPRRSTNPPLPINRFAGLTLATNVAPQMQNYQPQRTAVPAQTPQSAMSPGGNVPANNGFGFQNTQFRHHNLPAANPADQNPPCNTLYVGNLPMDASEDELKALFSKQRGYKRLCFRTKQNGPMCFVEFEDVHWSIKTLKELYGYTLSNSVKGGIRLSFSKNPLGVRNGQPGSINPSTPMTPQGPMTAANGFGGASGPVFTTANGPPPGLQAPPGLGAASMGMTNASMLAGNNPLQSPIANGPGSTNNGLGIGTNGINNARNPGGPTTPGAGGMNGNTTQFPDYMMGR